MARAAMGPARARARDTRTLTTRPGGARLVLFDIDGTLIRVHAEADDGPYVRAIRDILGTEVYPDWTRFKNATDSGIVREVLEGRLGRAPTPQEQERTRERFLALLGDRCREHEGLFSPTPGARTALRHLLASGRWTVAIATGNWAGSALLKLKSAGVDCEGIPLASADDSEIRSEIVSVATERARAHYGGDFGAVVYVGDRTWDLEAARKMNIGFLGIGEGESAQALRAAGHAGPILSDLENEVLLRALDETGAG